MRSLLISLICFFPIHIIAQSIAPPVEWQHCYGGTLDDYGYGISGTSDGGFIFAGCSGSNDGNIYPKDGDPRHGGTCDYWAAKIASDSTIQFKVHLGGTASDVARVAFETSDGGYIIGGAASSNDVDITDHYGPAGTPDFWVVKLNSAGSVLWKKSYGGTSYDDFGSMIATPDGGFALCGGTQSNDSDVSGNHGSMDFWLAKIDGSGNVQWQNCFGGAESNGYEKAFDLKLCQDGGYILTGFTSSQTGQVQGNHSLDYDGWVVKTNASGNLQWAKCIGGTGQDGFYKVKQLLDGNFLIAGYTFSNDGDVTGKHGNNTYDDAWLTLLDSSGTLLWSKAYGGDSTDEFSTVQQDELGEILVGGYTKSINGDLTHNLGNYDFWFLSIDETGSIIWDSTYGGPNADVCADLAIANDGRVALIGYTKSDSIDVSGNHGTDTSIHPMYISRADYWVLDLGSVLSVHEIPKSTLNILPSLAHDRIQIFSNDFGEGTSFITVTNENGAMMLRKTINHQSQFLLDVSSFPQGIYFIEAKNEKLKAVSKFVKM